MKIVVFGANGRVGRLVVDELLSRGNSVRAFVHHEPRQKLEAVEYVHGDIYREDDVSFAVDGVDVVISCLGSWGTMRKDILAEGMKNIIPQMETRGISRIISLTGADASTEVDKPNWLQKLMHTALSILAGKIVRDGELHMELLAASKLDWTVLRSPVMNEKGTAEYALSSDYPLPWNTINRHAVAIALCDQLENRAHIKQVPYLHRA